MGLGTRDDEDGLGRYDINHYVAPAAVAPSYIIDEAANFLIDEIGNNFID